MEITLSNYRPVGFTERLIAGGKFILSTYHPFDLTKGMITVGRIVWNGHNRNWIELALTVAFVAHIALVCLVTIFLDLIVWPVSALYRYFHKETPKEII